MGWLESWKYRTLTQSLTLYVLVALVVYQSGPVRSGLKRDDPSVWMKGPMFRVLGREVDALSPERRRPIAPCLAMPGAPIIVAAIVVPRVSGGSKYALVRHYPPPRGASWNRSCPRQTVAVELRRSCRASHRYPLRNRTPIGVVEWTLRDASIGATGERRKQWTSERAWAGLWGMRQSFQADQGQTRMIFLERQFSYNLLLLLICY